MMVMPLQKIYPRSPLIQSLCRLALASSNLHCIAPAATRIPGGLRPDLDIIYHAYFNEADMGDIEGHSRAPAVLPEE